MEVDLDRLADYVGGALDGTPDAEAVRELVSTDGGWAEAYAALVAATALVRRDLRELAGEAVRVPPDVAERLDRALSAASARDGAAAHRLDARPTPSHPTQTHPAQSHPAQTRPSRSPQSHGPGVRRRWRTVALGITAAAAAVVVGFGAFGVLHGLNGVATDSAGSSTANKARPQAPGAPLQILSSGRDYTPATVGEVGGPSALSAQGLAGGRANSAETDSSSDLAGSLSRLTDPTAREACLSAIVAKYGGQVSVVDFARFSGTPALVAVVTGSSVTTAGRWIVVVGAGCGTGGLDERFSGAY